jgi:hypothetical protein
VIILLAIETASEPAFLCASKATADCSSDGPAAFLESLPAVALNHVRHGVRFAGRVVMPGKRLNEAVSLAEQLAECSELRLKVFDPHRGDGLAL